MATGVLDWTLVHGWDGFRRRRLRLRLRSGDGPGYPAAAFRDQGRMPEVLGT